MNENYAPENFNRCNQLAIAYIKFQIMNQVFCPREALRAGTLFPELYQPYYYSEKNTGGKIYG